MCTTHPLDPGDRMPTLPAATDAELTIRAADGEQAAFTALFDRYADRVHDHVARWSRDSELAAEATRHAFAALLDDLDSLREEQFVLVWLLRTARTHAVDQLRHTESDNDRADTRIAAALLAATPTDPAASPGDAAVSHDAAQLVWELAADLDDRTFTVLDLHVRQELSGPEIAAVLDTTLQEADALADRMRERLRTLSGAEVLRGASPLPVYGALARVRAPVSVRNGAMAAAADHFGTTPRPTGLHRALPLGIALLVLLGLVGGIASALRSTDPEPAGGPPTAAAELLPSPSPEPSPSPTPTLEALASASPEPTVVEEPTPTPEPSPSPTPSPTADPNPSPQPLAVSIDQPLADASFAATVQDDQGRQAAWVTVSATIDGGDQGTSIAWSSDRAPDDELLDTASGELLLWLSEPCTHTAHLLTVTAADGAGEEATDTVPVRITDTCKERLTVTIDRPRAPRTEGPFQRDPDDKTVTFRVAATASDDDVTWLWTTDDRGSMQRAPEGPRGQVSVVIDDCSTSASFTLLVEVSRADGSTAQHEREVRVDCGD